MTPKETPRGHTYLQPLTKDRSTVAEKKDTYIGDTQRRERETHESPTSTTKQTHEHSKNTHTEPGVDELPKQTVPTQR